MMKNVINLKYNELPETIQKMIPELHKVIMSKIYEVSKNDKYAKLKKDKDFKYRNFIRDIGNREHNDVPIGVITNKGNTCTAMIQITGHVLNPNKSESEKLFHQMMVEVYRHLVHKVKEDFQSDLSNDDFKEHQYEGFDIYTTPDVAKSIWKFNINSKSGAIDKYHESVFHESIKEDLSEYRFPKPTRNNLSKEEASKCKHQWVYGGGSLWCLNCGWFQQRDGRITKTPSGKSGEVLESTFEERSHSNLKYAFRYVKADDGRPIKIVYDLSSMQQVGSVSNDPSLKYASLIVGRIASSLNKNVSEIGFGTPKSLSAIKDTISDLIDRNFNSDSGKHAALNLSTAAKGNNDFTMDDMDAILSIINRKLKSTGNPTINKDKLMSIINDIDRTDMSNSKLVRFLKKFGDKSFNAKGKIVAIIDVNNGNKRLKEIYGTNPSEAVKNRVRTRYAVGEYDTDRSFKGTSVDPKNFNDKTPHRKKYMPESVDAEEYNTDMTEPQAKATLKTLTQNLINDFNNESKNKSMTQYTANIFANIITKNLLPRWAKGFNKFKITLDSYQSFNTLEFITPKMGPDFVSRFIDGRESLDGLLHSSPEIKIKMSPRIFHSIKNPDDAYNFFKSAIKYYDSQVETYGHKLMAEVMKLGHNMKRLISTTKLSGIVTYPLSMLFIFDDVDMSTKDTFKIDKDDIDSVNKFVKNISSRYAAPEKEKRAIVEDLKKMIKVMRESCEPSDTIRELSYLPEAVEKLYNGDLNHLIIASSREFIESQIDREYKPSPQVKYIQESYGVKKLKKIPTDLIAYIQIETEAIKDSNDKMILSSYTLGKIEIVEWYIELLTVGSKKYIVPHTKPYLELIRTKLLECYKKIMNTPIVKRDTIDIRYPPGYEG